MKIMIFNQILDNMGRIWELYGSYLAAIWELSESQQGYLGSQGALSHLGSYFVENTKTI